MVQWCRGVTFFITSPNFIVFFYLTYYFDEIAELPMTLNVLGVFIICIMRKIKGDAENDYHFPISFSWYLQTLYFIDYSDLDTVQSGKQYSF